MNYVFDVDGTLSFNGTSISAEITEGLKTLEKHGHHLIFASARPIRDLLPIVPEFRHNLLIGGNGAIVSQADTIKVMTPIATPDRDYLKALITHYNLDYVIDGDWDYAAHVSPDNLLIKQLDPDYLAHNVPLEQITTAIKAILLGMSEQQLERIIRLVNDHTNLEIVQHVGEGNLDLTAQNINKANALALLGIHDYIAFGNDMNDVKMLSQATTSFWVNSKSALHEQAGSFAHTIVAPDKVAAVIHRLG